MSEERVGFKLGSTLLDCPFFWRNFAQEINTSQSIEGAELIEEILEREYRGRYDYENKFVEFDSITDLVYFKMRWA